MEAWTSVLVLTDCLETVRLICVVDIEPTPAAQCSLRNRPNANAPSPSGSMVPLPSIGSTPDPSSNVAPMEEWGTGVPSGAFFKLNSKSSVNEDDDEEDIEEDVEGDDKEDVEEDDEEDDKEDNEEDIEEDDEEDGEGDDDKEDEEDNDEEE